MMDLFLIYSFIRRLSTPFKEWKAYELGIIDEKGNRLKSRKDLRTVAERDAFGIFDLMILKIKRLLEKVPGGNTRIGSYAAALWLIKEHEELLQNGDMLSEEFIEEKLVEYMSIVEDAPVAAAPVNNAGSGNVAGIGVGPDGEPGLTKAQMKKTKIIKRFKETQNARR